MALDRAALIHKRKGKYMAQVLERFEQTIEHRLPREAKGDVQDFKALVRERMQALATDAEELMQLDVVPNGAAQDIRDRLSPTGRP